MENQTPSFVTIQFNCAAGKEFYGRKTIANGTTLAEFLEQELRGQNLNNYRISLNRDVPSDMEYVLKEADRVTVSPTKVAAGC